VGSVVEEGLLRHMSSRGKSAKDVMSSIEAEAGRQLPVRGDQGFLEEDEWGDFQQCAQAPETAEQAGQRAVSDEQMRSGFDGLSQEQRYAIGALACAMLRKQGEDEFQRSFTDEYAQRIVARLDLPEGVGQGLLTLDVDDRQFESVVEQCVLMVGDEGSRFCAIQEMLSLALTHGKYDARARVLLQGLSMYFRIPWESVAAVELAIAMHLVDLSKNANEEDQEAVDQGIPTVETSKIDSKRRKKKQAIRVAKISGIAVAGGVLFGLTGGLIAPALLGSLAGIGVAGAATLSATGTAASGAVVGSLFGVGGMAVAGNKARRRTRTSNTEFDFERPDDPRIQLAKEEDRKGRKKLMNLNRKVMSSFAKRPVESQNTPQVVPSLHICLCVPAWLSSSAFGSSIAQFTEALDTAVPCAEHVALRWESQRLRQMGKAFASFWASKATVTTVQQVYPTILASTSAVAGAVASAIALPLTALSAMDYIDNPWSVLISRANGAGQELADVLCDREYGDRPVTLVGYSHGARVIFKCLEVLAQRRVYGIVDNAFLIGAPVSADAEQWGKAKQAVSGRFVNAFSGTDWALAVFHRATSHGFNIAGLTKIEHDDIENVNMAFLGVRGHGDLRYALARCFVGLGVGTNRVSMSPAPLVLRSARKRSDTEFLSGTNRDFDSDSESESDREGDQEELFRPRNGGSQVSESENDYWSSEGDFILRRLDEGLFLTADEISQRSNIVVNEQFAELAKRTLPQPVIDEASVDIEEQGSREVADFEEPGKVKRKGSKTWFSWSNSRSKSSSTSAEISGDAKYGGKEEDELPSLSSIVLESQVTDGEDRTLAMSLGIEITGRRVLKFFERGTLFPTSRTELFTNGADGQRSMTVRVFEGESNFVPLRLPVRGGEKGVKESRLIGEVELTLNEAEPRGRLRSSVSMEVDEQGTVTVAVAERRRGGTRGQTCRVVIERKHMTSMREWRTLLKEEQDNKKRARDRQRASDTGNNSSGLTNQSDSSSIASPAVGPQTQQAEPESISMQPPMSMQQFEPSEEEYSGSEQNIRDAVLRDRPWLA